MLFGAWVTHSSDRWGRRAVAPLCHGCWCWGPSLKLLSQTPSWVHASLLSPGRRLVPEQLKSDDLLQSELLHSHWFPQSSFQGFKPHILLLWLGIHPLRWGRFSSHPYTHTHTLLKALVMCMCGHIQNSRVDFTKSITIKAHWNLTQRSQSWPPGPQGSLRRKQVLLPAPRSFHRSAGEMLPC